MRREGVRRERPIDRFPTDIDFRRLGKIDPSCGAGALEIVYACFGLRRPESQIIGEMVASGTNDCELRENGPDWKTMREHLKRSGKKSYLRPDSDWNDLSFFCNELGLPSVIKIEDWQNASGSKSRPYYTVVREVKERRIIIADPLRGFRTLTRREFEELWHFEAPDYNRVIMAVADGAADIDPYRQVENPFR